MTQLRPDRRHAAIASFKRTQSFTEALKEFGVHDFRRKMTEITTRLPMPGNGHAFGVDVDGFACQHRTGLRLPQQTRFQWHIRFCQHRQSSWMFAEAAL